MPQTVISELVRRDAFESFVQVEYLQENPLLKGFLRAITYALHTITDYVCHKQTKETFFSLPQMEDNVSQLVRLQL